MARKKIREYDSKRLVKEHFKRIFGSDLAIKSAQITESTDLNEQDKRLNHTQNLQTRLGLVSRKLSLD
ncbi:putative ATP citrate synthase [Helianthus annuus]|nr:putative ATP citrate synthase [Helianthus annuus]